METTKRVKVEAEITVDTITFDFKNDQIVVRGKHNMPGKKAMIEFSRFVDHQELCDTVLQVGQDSLEDAFNGSSAVPAARD